MLLISEFKIASVESPGKYRIVSWSACILDMYSSSETKASGSLVEWNLIKDTESEIC